MKPMRHAMARAFTLIELLVVISIIAIMMALLVPQLSQARNTAKDVICKSRMRQVYQAIEQYRGEYKEFYPATNLTNANTLWDNIPWNWDRPTVRCLDLILPYLNVPAESVAPGSTQAQNILMCPFARYAPGMTLAELRQTAFSTGNMYANYWQSARFGYNNSGVKYRVRKTPPGKPDSTVLFADLFGTSFTLYGHNTLNPNYMSYIHPDQNAHVAACDGRIVDTKATTAAQLQADGLAFTE